MAANLASRLFPCAAFGLLAAAGAANMYGCSSDGGSRGTTGTSGGGTTGTVTGSSGTATTGSATTGSATTGSATTGSATTGSATTGSTTGSAPTDGGADGVCSLPAVPPGLILYSGGVPAPLCPGNTDFNNQGFFSYNDGTSDSGTFVHTADFGGCDGANDCAFHVSGGGFTGYGAGVGFALDTANTPLPGDAGANYHGMQLWLKGTTTGTRQVGYAVGNNFVHVKFVTSTNRQGDDFGGYCPTQTTASGGTSFILCNLPFSGIKRDGFKNVDAGAPDPSTDVFDPQNLEKIQFEFSSYTPPADAASTVNVVSFDVWLDDIAFF